ncbi:salicylate hydroxylase [Pholiota conissans]|uniref:Salicylate hydroxylase n=1 Tax=Pholiota conissans TaxID=109636 RepID=A0A9P6D3N4_9AGAR|nr:salicylate hydroxylase [Pholiota conissans]
MDDAKLRLAIIGGGIGGLTLALALSRFDVDSLIQIDIYESAAKLTEVGAGIGFWPRGWEIVKDLGLEEDLITYITPGQGPPSAKVKNTPFIIKKSDSKDDIELPDVSFRSTSITFHRADVQNVLLKHLPSTIPVHLSKRLVSYRESDQGTELHFKNGETATCDMLVGADGVHSVVRKGLLARMYDLSEEEVELKARPVWSGVAIYRSVFESDPVRKQIPDHPTLTKPIMYFGKSKHVVCYPISRGKLINVAAICTEFDKEGTYLEGPAVTQSSPDTVLSVFTTWSEEVQSILKNVKNPTKWAVEVVRPLEKYAHGSVFLLGDAAHAMTPNLAIGAGQALEDSYILAQVLNKALRSGKAFDPSKVAEVYSAIRTPLGNSAAEASRLQGQRIELELPGFEDVKEGDTVSPERLASISKEIEKGSDWAWDAPISADVERALKMI